MNLSDVQFIFNRALSQTFSKKKLLFVFAVLALSGLLVVFFRGLAENANQWLLLSLTFLPIFLCSGILFSTGILLIRIYHDEIKNKPISYKEIIGKSWEIIIGASYFSIPIILCYLLLWMLLGIFVLFREIPVVGQLFTVVLSFGPFILNLGSIILCLLSLSMLFYVAPVVALRGINRFQTSQILVNRFKNDLFSNLFLGFIGSMPILFIVGVLTLAAFMTGSICYACVEPVYQVLQWFFIMIPFTAILAPAIVFFFNFAAESHVLLQREIKHF